jgi:hypothetical protein
MKEICVQPDPMCKLARLGTAHQFRVDLVRAFERLAYVEMVRLNDGVKDSIYAKSTSMR